MRSDLPAQLFDQLLAKASEKVRSKLQAEREFAEADIDAVVGEVTDRIQVSAAAQPISYAAAQVLVESMHRAGQLTAGKLQEFGCGGLVRRNGCRAFHHVERTDGDHRTEHARPAAGGLARLCQCDWPLLRTTRSIMMLAAKRHRRSTVGVDQAMPAFHRLRQSTDFHGMSNRSARSH